ncbi:MAG: hypothetical protein EBR59_11260 [Methylococcaceae bacterium]|nr:hypothetical protein [Methylococcaceae bacterium]
MLFIKYKALIYLFRRYWSIKMTYKTVFKYFNDIFMSLLMVYSRKFRLIIPSKVNLFTGQVLQSFFYKALPVTHQASAFFQLILSSIGKRSADTSKNNE